MIKFIKNSILTALLAVISTMSFAEETAPAAPAPVTDDDVAYFFGYRFGNALLEGGNENVDPKVVMKGLEDPKAATGADGRNRQCFYGS